MTGKSRSQCSAMPSTRRAVAIAFRTAVALAVALAAQALCAAPVIMTQGVVLPDGTPAAGAQVTVRIINPDGSLREDTGVETNERGIFSLEVEAPEQVGPPGHTGYLLVRAPGCALCLAPLPPPQEGFTMPVNLRPAFTVSGTVVDEGKAPAGGARVAVISLHSASSGLGSLFVNAPLRGLTTPELTAVTAEDGTFSLPGVTGPQASTFTAYLDAETDDLIATETYMNLLPQTPPAKLGLRRGITVSGHVLHAVTGQPLEGARVSLLGGPGHGVGARPPVVTDERGAFRHTKIPRLFKLFVTVEADDLVNDWAEVSGEQDSEDVIIKLRPWATVSGKTVDEATGAAPIVRCSEVTARYREGSAKDRPPVIHPQLAKVRPPAADGTFTFRTAAGPNRIWASGNAFKSQKPMSIDVPPEGLSDLVVPVRRQTSFAVRFESDTPDGLKEINLDVQESEDKCHTEGRIDPEWSRHTANWGDKMVIRIRRAGEVVLPWTEIVADPNNWPLVLKLK